MANFLDFAAEIILPAVALIAGAAGAFYLIGLVCIAPAVGL
jgi:hypothetical protein